MDSAAVLPPVGLIGPNDHSLVTQYLSALVKEASGGAADWIQQAERNLNIFTYGADPQPDRCDVVSNQISDACNAVTDFQTREPVNKTLNPVERGEPGQVYYFEGDAIQGPFTEDQAAQMQQPTQSMDAVSGEVVQGPPQFDPRNFVTIDDKTTAEFFQKQLDVYWLRGNLDKSTRTAVHYCNIFGYLFPIYEWEKDYHRPRLWTDISLKDTYVDPTRASIEDAAYMGVDWWIDAQQAMTMFPHLADVITERARTGTPERPSSETQLGFNVENANRSGGFRRNTIILRIMWLRNQPCPYEANEALQAGLLERQMVPVIDPNVVIPNETEQFPKGDNDSNQNANAEGISDGDGEAASGADVGGAGQALQAPSPPQRPALYANGQEVTAPTDPGWPMYRCVRQITAVLGLVVDDRECEYWDAPMLQFLSTPIPYQPFGQGLPQRLEAMQRARTTSLTAIRDHINYNAHPVGVIPESAWDLLPAEYKEEGASRAGMTIRLTDDLWKQVNGKPSFFIDPPQMNESLIKGEEIFHNELSERSGSPDVLQGNPPPGVTGWQSIQLLSQNASSRFGFSMQWTKDMQVRLCRFVLHDLMDSRKVTPQDLRAVDSRYPVGIVQLFQQRGVMMDWDIDVDIQNGIGSARNKKQAEAIEANKIIDPITGEPAVSTESLRDALGVDHQQEEMRNAQARQIAMQQQAQTMQMQTALAPEKPKSKSSEAGSNGNGNGRMHFGGQ